MQLTAFMQLPTLLHCGVQLGDFDSKAINSVLKRIGSDVEAVSLIKQLTKYVFCMFAWRREGRRAPAEEL